MNNLEYQLPPGEAQQKRTPLETEYFGEVRVTHFRPTIDGTRIHYTESGSGSRVIILGGLPFYAWEGFVGFIRPFSKNHTVNVFEYPGFGESDELKDKKHTFEEATEILHKTIQKENLGPSHVVGLSFGGGVAIHLAAKYPEDVRSLAIMGTPVEFASWIRETRSILKHPVSIRTAKRFIFNEGLWPLFFGFLISDPEPAKKLYGQRWAARLAKKYASISPKAMLGYSHSILDTREDRWFELGRQIKAPTAIVISRQEAEKKAKRRSLDPHQTGKRLKTMIPHAEILVNPDVATLLGHGKGKSFAQVVLPFIQDIDTGAKI